MEAATQPSGDRIKVAYWPGCVSRGFTPELHGSMEKIAPLLPGYRRRHPEIAVRLRLSDHLLDLLVEAVDVAVRMDAFADSSLVIRRVAELPRVLCAAPDYLARHGTPRSLADLARHQCLMLRFPGSAQFRWPFPDRDNKPLLVAPSGGLDADDGDVLTDWALAGEGILLKPVFEVAEHLHAGSLVRVLPEQPPLPTTLALLHPYGRTPPAKVKAFADLVTKEARSHIARRMALLPPETPPIAAGDPTR